MVGAIVPIIILIGGNAVQLNRQKQKQKEHERQELILKTNELDAQLKAKEAERQQLEKQKQELEQRLQAKLETQQVRVASVKQYALPDNEAKAYIYMHESGNNPERWNSSGCVGLGQACPASKLLAVCPVLTDYACQDAWFTNYATKRYGGWSGAYQFWLAHNWW